MKTIKVGKMFITVMIAVLIVAALSSCALFPSQDEPAMPTLKTPKPISYAFYEVVSGTLESKIEGTGTVTSIYYTSHAFPTSGGHIKGLYVTLGQYVNKGDLLAELDNTSIEMDYLQATINYERAKETFSQQKNDHDAGKLSDTEYRIAELTFENVEKTYLNYKTAYENTTIYAQVSGKVVYINTAYTTAGGKEIVAGDPVVAIDSEDPKYTYLVFDKKYDSEGKEYTPEQFRIGAKLTLNEWFTEEGTPIEYFNGTIVGTDKIMNDTGLGYVSDATYYCKMENIPESVSYGDTIRYSYTVFSIPNVLQIPASAYFEYDGTAYVYMLDENTNLKKEVAIRLGNRNEMYVEVVEGLEAGDLIVLS